MQRQREQQMIEKLKQSQPSAAQKFAAVAREKQVENIFPQAEHGEYKDCYTILDGSL